MSILPITSRRVTKICKRDGRIVDFDQEKIATAIFKAMEATATGDKKLAEKLSDKVTAKINKKFHERTIPAVEEIQDLVEETLVEAGLAKTVRAYILYREQHKQLRDYQAFIDSDKIMQGYLNQTDWKVKENANMTFSLQGLNNHVASAVSKHYWLNKIYSPEVQEAHSSGDFHIHDLYMLAPYCTGWDLKDLLVRGFGGVSGKIQCAPAKHLRVALGQIVNFFYTLQGEIAGAVAFSNFDTYLAPFIHYDQLDYQQVKQAMQEFLFNMNVPTRTGFQTPFTNITLDLKVPKIIAKEPVIIGGEPQEETYSDFQKEVDLLNKAFAEVMIGGDANGRVFTFPIPTYNITKNFGWESELADKIFEMTAKYGTPYFSNFVNSDMDPDDARSMCPLAGDEKVLVKSPRGRNLEYSTIRYIYEGNSKQEEYEIFSDGGFVKGHFNKFKKQKMIKVVLENGHEIKMSGEHLNFVMREEGASQEVLAGTELKAGMYLPYSLNKYQGEGGNSDLGYFVGAFAGDGSLDGAGTVIFSLEGNYKKELIGRLERIAKEYFGAHSAVKDYQGSKLVSLKVHSRAAVGLCRDFVSGIKWDKHYRARLFATSVEFRKNVLAGHYATDGGNRNRIYTSSSKMMETLNMLAATLGTTTSIYKDDRPNRLGSEPNYAVLIYQLNRKRYGKVWFKNGKKLWVRIKAIKPIVNSTAYCFEVRNGEPMFTVGTTGILTHNCRLRLDNRELRKRGGGLFGANPLTGCYDGETEILTQGGWKFFKDLIKSDKVFTLTQNNEIELHKPRKIFVYDYKGEMYQFKTKSLDLLVTPNHQMVVDQAGSGCRKFVEAQNFDVNNHRIPKQSIWKGEDKEWFILPRIEFTKYGRQGRTSYRVARDSLKIKMDDWLKFFGFWLAEGCADNEKIAKRHGYRVIITQVDKRTREEIEEVLDVLPFSYYKERNNFIICNKQLWTYLRQFGNRYEKFIPNNLKKLNKRQLKILFNWMVKGDGHVRKTTGQINYWTSSKKLADDLQEIILKLGWLGTSIEQNKKTSEIKGRRVKAGHVYALGVQQARHYRLRKQNIKRIYYDGKVYCCEVENHTVLVRRNGRVSWCGNSIGVVTINMARLGYLSKNKEEYYERLEKLMRLARQSLEVKRDALNKFTDEGLYPYCRVYLEGIKKRFGTYWKNHFNTIGVNGMNESVLNFMAKDIASAEGNKFAGEVLDFMREKLMDYQIESNDLYNLESTPAEGTSYRFARIDKEKYPDIIVANEQAVRTKQADPFYTNSTHLPVDYTDDIFKALDLQDNLQTKYTGGTVFHGFIGEKLPDLISTKNLVKKIAENYHLPYYTITPTFSICSEHGYLVGEHLHCSDCGRETEVYSRVVGYLRPVQQWNKGKQAEFEARKEYRLANDKAIVSEETRN